MKKEILFYKNPPTCLRPRKRRKHNKFQNLTLKEYAIRFADAYDNSLKQL